MPRPKEFDEAEVLDRALQLFRARGFKHTSFADLTSELGVSRQSLYDTYGDKHTLFQTALHRYLDRAVEFITNRLDAPGKLRPTLHQLFDDLIGMNCGGGSHGCLMVNAMVELAPLDDATRALAHSHARKVEGLLVTRLSLAQRQGDLAKDKDPVALARFLYHTLLGLGVATRAFGEPASLRQSMQLALQVLD